MSRLQGKVALISGGASGIGAATARKIVSEGGRVVVGDVNDEAGLAFAKSLGEAVTFVHLDVTQPHDWKASVAHALTSFGRLDILVNNAGIMAAGPIESITLEIWRRALDVNLTGAFNGLQAVLPTFKAASAGVVINVASAMAVRGYPMVSAYTASKSGLRGLALSAAMELAPHGIRINTVLPGLTQTPFSAGVGEELLDTIPGRRIAAPEEIANVIAFAASDEASYVSGTELIVDAGAHAGYPPALL